MTVSLIMDLVSFSDGKLWIAQKRPTQRVTDDGEWSRFLGSCLTSMESRFDGDSSSPQLTSTVGQLTMEWRGFE
jgi:hypothetical protein